MYFFVIKVIIKSFQTYLFEILEGYEMRGVACWFIMEKKSLEISIELVRGRVVVLEARALFIWGDLGSSASSSL